MQSCVLNIFAKAPIPGRVKTRLAPALGISGAAALHRTLVEYAIQQAKQSAIGTVELHCSPTTHFAFFNDCRRRYDVELKPQIGNDLGERMSNAMYSTLRSADFSILIGADCPALSAEDLAAARSALRQGNEAVLVPAFDGGYTLIGLRCFSSTLFSNISWGGSDVYAATCDRLRNLGWRWKELEPRWDLDRPGDLARLKAMNLPLFAPFTAGSAEQVSTY